MVFIKEAVPEESPESSQSQGEGPGEEMEEYPGVGVSQATTGQLEPESRAELLGMLGEYNSKEFFPLNPNVGPVVKRREVPLKLIDENVTPVECKTQKYSPAAAGIVSTHADTWLVLADSTVSKRKWGLACFHR